MVGGSRREIGRTIDAHGASYSLAESHFLNGPLLPEWKIRVPSPPQKCDLVMELGLDGWMASQPLPVRSALERHQAEREGRRRASNSSEQAYYASYAASWRDILYAFPRRERGASVRSRAQITDGRKERRRVS